MKGNVTAQTHWLKDCEIERLAGQSSPSAAPLELLADLERLTRALRAKHASEQ